MIKTIKNKTVHIITLKSGVILKYQTKKLDITEKEEIKYADKIECDGKVVDKDKIITKLKQPEKPVKKGIINKYIVDNYMGKNTRGMLNDLEEDKDQFTPEDLDLLYDYESKHRNRIKVLNKIKQLRS